MISNENIIKIGFFTSLNANVGDDFIREGVKAILDTLDFPYESYYVNKVDKTSLCQLRADEGKTLKHKYWQTDLFIQAGTPVYWHLLDGKSTSLTVEWYNWFWENLVLDTKKIDHPCFVNFGAGSCQPWGDDGSVFLRDTACADFAKAVAKKSKITIVRDPVADDMLSKLDVKHSALPCPAFLAAVRHKSYKKTSNRIGINLMELGGHFDLKNDFDKDAWKFECFLLVSKLRSLGDLLFICHDEQEYEFAQNFVAPTENIFYSKSFRDYFDAYASCAIVVANRVHGAVCAAGFGVPSIIIGNDTRATIGDFIGLYSCQAKQNISREVFRQAEKLFNTRQQEHERLLSLRNSTIEQYASKLKPIVEELLSSSTKKNQKSLFNTPKISLASVAELESEAFKNFMLMINKFASKHSLRTFTNWSKIWEYPWLWFNCLGKINWHNKCLVDIGSEISPMPWFIAALGAKVTLIEVDKQWLPVWEKLKAELGLNIDWHIVQDEKLPISDNTADVVTSFSTIEHQPDKNKAINEVIRVLKPGGLFALSFDICEPEMGMTFPEWNGQALTMKEFEKIVWNHPNLKYDVKLKWNVNDIPEFIKWHLQSAKHHNYTVGAAVLAADK